MTCTALAWIAVLILLPLVFLFWLTESRRQRCRRLRSYGWSQQKIADHMHIGRTTVRRELATT
jgi:IS30 family transposase